MRVERAIARVQSGDRETAREDGAALWAALPDDEQGDEKTDGKGDRKGEGRHAMLRCLLAHHLADVQDDPRDELTWDLRALDAASQLTDDAVRAHHPALSLAQLYPSLHLNLAEDYRKLNDIARAREHLTLAEQAVEALPDREYGAMIRGGIARLRARMEAER